MDFFFFILLPLPPGLQVCAIHFHVVLEIKPRTLPTEQYKISILTVYFFDFLFYIYGDVFGCLLDEKGDSDSILCSEVVSCVGWSRGMGGPTVCRLLLSHGRPCCV